MGLLKCLSPRASSMKESDLRSELHQVKAQLAEAKVTIADLQQGSALSDGRIGTRVAPSKTSVAVQAKPPVECESRIPRPDEVPSVRPSGAGPAPWVSVNEASTAAAGGSVPLSPGALRSPKAAGAATASSPARGMFKSRIPASPSPDGPRRSHSLRQSAASAASHATAAPTTLLAAAGEAGGEEASSQTSSEAGAGALAESSSQARADFLASQLRIADAFRQDLEAELRDLRFKNAGLQTQVLTLQTRLEKAMQAQVDELDHIERLRKGAGSTDSRGYEEALAELAVLKRQLAEHEADKTVAEQQAQAATELASSHQMQLSATAAELSCVKADLASAQGRVLELSAEGARLKQQLHKLGKAQARAEELEAALAAAKEAAAAAAAEHEERMAKLSDELATSKAISESNCEELLALSAAHSELKQAHYKMEAESKQHDQLVHIVQQELAEMSYFAAAGRVALGLCSADNAPLISGAVVVTPTHSGCLSPQLVTSVCQATAAAASTAQAQEEGTGSNGNSQRTHRSSSSNGKGASTSGSQKNSKLVEDSTAVCIAAAAAAGAAAAIAAGPAAAAAATDSSKPGSSNSSSRTVSPRNSRTVSPRVSPRRLQPVAEQLATQAAAPAAAAAREAAAATGNSAAGEAAQAACIAAAVEAARVALEDPGRSGAAEGSCSGEETTDSV